MKKTRTTPSETRNLHTETRRRRGAKQEHHVDATFGEGDGKTDMQCCSSLHNTVVSALGCVWSMIPLKCPNVTGEYFLCKLPEWLLLLLLSFSFFFFSFSSSFFSSFYFSSFSFFSFSFFSFFFCFFFYFFFLFSSSFFGITVLGALWPLPKLSSTLFDPVN